MLNVKCPEHMEAMRELSKKVDAAESLQEQLDFLERLGTNLKADEVCLTKEDAGFFWQLMRDGKLIDCGSLLIYGVGQSGVGAPHFSVCIEEVKKPKWVIN